MYRRCETNDEPNVLNQQAENQENECWHDIFWLVREQDHGHTLRSIQLQRDFKIRADFLRNYYLLLPLGK